MLRSRPVFSAAVLAAATILASACADVTSPASDLSASLAKSGTTASGGGSGGGGSSTGGTSSTPSGPPVAPSFTARLDSIGVVPTAVYYGTPSEWTVGGYVFHAGYTTHLRPVTGPLVVGACVAVTFSESEPGYYYASELKTVDASKCGG